MFIETFYIVQPFKEKFGSFERNNYTRGVQLILCDSIVMSRTHAIFLLKFYGMVEEFPRLMNCEWTQIFILQKPENYQVYLWDQSRLLEK